MISKIVVLGAGNLAHSFISVIKNTDIEVLQIYNRHLDKAQELAKFVNAEAISNVEEISSNADAYFFLLSDTGIIEISKQINIDKNKILLHSAGSLSMDIFKGKTENYGVFYPFQTFSKEFPIDFTTAPICLEASNTTTLNSLKNFSQFLGCTSYDITEDQRTSIHLSGVFACNFMNHCIFLGEQILKNSNVDIELMHPLLEQSFKKALHIGAENAQTGPARRMDKVVIDRQLELLKNNEQMSGIYKMLTESIYRTYKS